MRTLGFVGAALMLTACGRADAPQQPAAENQPYEQQTHLASPASGAVIIARSGEYNLVNSSLMAVDGSLDVGWWSPADELRQWLILRLPARAALARIRIPAHEEKRTADRVLVEASSDEQTWTELAVMEPRGASGELIADAGGTEATHLRITMSKDTDRVSMLHEIVIEGEELTPRGAVDWDGRWQLNNRTADLHSSGSMVFGVIPFQRSTMRLVGRPRGGFMPFAWSKGNVVGYGALAISPEGFANGLWYWEDPYTWRMAETWFGARSGPAQQPVKVDRRTFALDFLREGLPSPFFELAFDGDAPVSSEDAEAALGIIRSIARSNPGREFRLSVWNLENDQQARARIAALQRALMREGERLPNLSFTVKAGNLLDQPPRGPLVRAIYERVDLEVRPPGSGDAASIVLR